MISTLEEVRTLKRMVADTKAQLKRDGVAFAEKVPLGIMLEVPAAALSIHSLLPEVDYISIGSNDLIQYVMAADRDNPKVAHLCEPFSPPLFRLLRYVLKACDRHGKPATLCGEMAGRPRCFLPLLGMGLRRFSMSPAFVPTIKELARSTCLNVAHEVAARVVRLRTFKKVRGYLTATTRQVCPNVTFLDTKK
jgi:phosphoenolpyruvate-protein kinase (PTS system EI component)